MDQDPRYLRNQSRQLHAGYRRNRRVRNIGLSIWAGVFIALFGLAATDRIARLDWGFADQLWSFLAFGAFAPCFWIVGTLTDKLVLAFVRHIYGPDPGGSLEQ